VGGGPKKSRGGLIKNPSATGKNGVLGGGKKKKSAAKEGNWAGKAQKQQLGGGEGKKDEKSAGHQAPHTAWLPALVHHGEPSAFRVLWGGGGGGGGLGGWDRKGR